ncbi:hypothetical protein L596_001830 [Steinernema carpocapsae]|uniref:Uncharacterized protein n=1 Tax=Steinernema carpocapsae TaxID=34508 RepID=A0A4U8UMW6_STECR|nr:hypothetical protein L596_001830 [Steinernema carpocapsae]
MRRILQGATVFRFSNRPKNLQDCSSFIKYEKPSLPPDAGGFSQAFYAPNSPPLTPPPVPLFGSLSGPFPNPHMNPLSGLPAGLPPGIGGEGLGGIGGLPSGIGGIGGLPSGIGGLGGPLPNPFSGQGDPLAGLFGGPSGGNQRPEDDKSGAGKSDAGKAPPSNSPVPGLPVDPLAALAKGGPGNPLEGATGPGPIPFAGAVPDPRFDSLAGVPTGPLVGPQTPPNAGPPKKDKGAEGQPLAGGFDSGIDLNYGSAKVGGIPFYPINDEGAIEAANHGKVGYGDWGGGYSHSQGVRDYYSQHSDYGANVKEGKFGYNTGWSVPLVQSLGIEGGGGTAVNIPMKKGEEGPIDVDTGYGVGGYYKHNDHVGVDWKKGDVSHNFGVGVPFAGVGLNTGFGLHFPSLDTFSGKLGP